MLNKMLKILLLTLGRVFSRNDFSGGSNLDKAHKADITPKDNTDFGIAKT